MSLARVLSRNTARAVAVVACLAVAGAGAFVVLRPHHVTRVVAHFTRAVGVYPGSDVRVLGVRIGTITKVTPEGGTVRVELEYDADRKVPADAVAVVVPPSLVSDRYVQLAPVYQGGPVLADGAEIPLSRTASPVELDEIYRSLDDLSVALGPQGANRDGALSRLLQVGADNLDGNGALVNQGVDDLDRAVATLSAHRDDLFGSVKNLQVFVSALADSDRQVRQFNGDLASVAQQLADERVALAAALKNLAAALDQVTSFVHDNRAALHANLAGLAQVSGTLVHQRAALAEVLDTAPAALSNVSNAYNPVSGTLDTRNNFNQLGDPAFVCGLLMSLPAASQAVAQAVGRCEQAARLSQTFAASLAGVLRSLGVPFTPPRPADAAPAAPTAPGTPPAATGELPTIPGVTGQPAGPDLLPTLPGVGSGGGDVTTGLTDALGSLLGGGP